MLICFLVFFILSVFRLSNASETQGDLMVTIVVNTRADVMNASDGVTSVREAVAAAKAGVETHISFDRALFTNPADGAAFAL